VSRVGKRPISIPSGVQVSVSGQMVNVKGPKGELSRELHPQMMVSVNDGSVEVSRPNDAKLFKSMHGLYRTLISNMITGVTKHYEKKLEIVGVGFKAEMKNKRLNLQLGFSHPVVFVPPPSINITCESPTNMTISGPDKELVGLVAAKIRKLKPPEPYKGKGIKYFDEIIRRKAGKTAA